MPTWVIVVIVGVFAVMILGVIGLAMFPGAADELDFSQPRSKGIVGGLLGGLLGG
jgi:hypothetical protein